MQRKCSKAFCLFRSLEFVSEMLCEKAIKWKVSLLWTSENYVNEVVKSIFPLIFFKAIKSKRTLHKVRFVVEYFVPFLQHFLQGVYFWSKEHFDMHIFSIENLFSFERRGERLNCRTMQNSIYFEFYKPIHF